MFLLLESESTNKISFLDAEISRVNGRFKTTVYHKPTFSSVSAHFDSFLSTTYKFSMIYTLVCTLKSVLIGHFLMMK